MIDLDHVNKFTIYNIVKEAEDIERIFSRIDKRNLNSAANRFINIVEDQILNIWKRDNFLLRKRLEALEYSLQQQGVEDLPDIDDILDETYIRSTEETDGWTREERLFYHGEDVRDRVNDKDIEGKLIRKKQKIIDNSDSLYKQTNQNILNRRKEEWIRSKLKVGYYKRLLFAEAMKQNQIANAVYFEQAGFYFLRWNLSLLHKVGDICDVYAHNIWLDSRDQDEYYNLTGDTDFGGVIPTADFKQDILLPELEDWSDGKIASAIRQYSNQRKIDLRRKLAGNVQPHANCLCFTAPILESKV
ncbi:MAG: hypothetical protein AABY07_10980 [Nanoarchaeota archaeon]